MDITAIVTELRKERDRLSRAIEVLEGSDVVGTKSGAPTLVIRKGKKGNHLSAEGRKRLSEMMKKRWAERRKKGTVGRKVA
jgi:hypothetical protein